jgi:hypothetical protein
MLQIRCHGFYAGGPLLQGQSIGEIQAVGIIIIRLASIHFFLKLEGLFIVIGGIGLARD